MTGKEKLARGCAYIRGSTSSHSKRFRCFMRAVLRLPKRCFILFFFGEDAVGRAPAGNVFPQCDVGCECHERSRGSCKNCGRGSAGMIDFLIFCSFYDSETV